MSSVRSEGSASHSDCIIRLVTPERIVIAHPLAGPSRRFMAYLIDQVLLIVLLISPRCFSALFVTMGSQSALGPFLLAYFVLTWGYGAFCEGLFNGQTVGKRAIGIRVVSERGVPISGAQAVLRNLVGSVDGLLPFFYQTALVSMLLSPKFQRLGDLAAGTMVVIEERALARGVTRIDDPEVAALLRRLPSRITVGSDLARVLSSITSRPGIVLARSDAPRWPNRSQGPLRKRSRAPLTVFRRRCPCVAVYHQIFVGE